MKTFFQKYALIIAWVQALVAMLGSLYFSEVLKYPPCVLCWWQRIAIYPMVLLLAVGIIRKDRAVFFYTMPVLVVGWFISLYHNLLYYKIIPDTLAPCSLGVSCTTRFIQWFGFITIPFLAFTALTVMIAMLTINHRLNNLNQHTI